VTYRRINVKTMWTVFQKLSWYTRIIGCSLHILKMCGEKIHYRNS